MLPFTPNHWFPDLEAPLEVRDFSYDATTDITFFGAVDPILTVAVSASPSGTGEVIPTLVTQSANIVTTWLTSGIPGRVYTYQIVLTTAGGRVIPVYVGQCCDPLRQTHPMPPAPVPGFGTPITWAFGTVFDFSIPADSAYSILI